MWNKEYDDGILKQMLESMKTAGEYKRTSRGIRTCLDNAGDALWQNMDNGGRPIKDDKVENMNISKRCVVRYDDEDRVARYDFDREQWICCVRGVVLHDVKYFMQIPEFVED